MATFVLDPSVHMTASVPRFIKQFQRKQYRDKKFPGGEAEWKKRLEQSTTVYIGNLSCYTTEYQLYELFTRCGSIRRIIMGLDSQKKTPCGFCFVEFDDRDSALKSINFLNRTKLDGREIQVDIDAGFEEGRQYGRGTHGGQLGDERKREQGSGYGGPRGTPGSTPILTRSITVVACLAMISILLITCQPTLADNETNDHNQTSTSSTTVVSVSPSEPTSTTSPAETSTEATQSKPKSRGKTRNVSLRRNYYSMPKPHMALNSRPSTMNPTLTAQLEQARAPYETAFAQFLVNIMKAAKPTLMTAFIKATLADKQLKEIAIKAFFNNPEEGEE